MEQFGVIALTGEADALSYRILCDLKTYAVDLLADVYGLSGKQAFRENWNNSQGQVASVMLGHDEWQAIAPVALIRQQCHTVFLTTVVTRAEDMLDGNDQPKLLEAIKRLRIPHSVIGLQENEKLLNAEYEEQGDKIVQTVPYRLVRDGEEYKWPERHYGRIDRFYQHGSGPHVGTRNVHAMSGRVE